MTNNIGCLIVNDNLPIKLLIDENFVYKSFKVTGNNHETLDYTVYLFNM